MTIPIPHAAMVIALDGGTDRLAGMNPSSAKAIEDGILGEFFPEASEIPSDITDESFAPNIETVAGLDPDLVLQWSDRGDEIVRPLENAGLTTAALTSSTQDELEAALKMVGAAIGEDDRAERILDWHDEVRRELAELDPPEQRPSVLYFHRMAEELRVSGSDTYNDFYIELAGGTNAAAEITGRHVVEPEQVAAWDPDVILVGSFDDATVDDVAEHPAWRELTAVTERRVYQVPLGGYRWDPPSHESPLMWQWLAQLLHPDGIDVDLPEQIREHYDFLYDQQAVSDEQIREILRAELNAGTAGYDRVLRE
ncbi:ABC transporter substrate-binding protein [Haloechinothrix sp. LS1_15]|uniref:ABC transporter substrate-binding protein n=1 Tax=Haloechinothrix sp. LS1_15 TaxID=2652248 RepID=UPI00294AAC2A|nr:ABC transporter substrate-binding protein [Haloechinothrix sp. LS1_15]